VVHVPRLCERKSSVESVSAVAFFLPFQAAPPRQCMLQVVNNVNLQSSLYLEHLLQGLTVYVLQSFTSQPDDLIKILLNLVLGTHLVDVAFGASAR
jgi:hypothetical protein